MNWIEFFRGATPSFDLLVFILLKWSTPYLNFVNFPYEFVHHLLDCNFPLQRRWPVKVGSYHLPFLWSNFCSGTSIIFDSFELFSIYYMELIIFSIAHISQSCKDKFLCPEKLLVEGVTVFRITRHSFWKLLWFFVGNFSDSTLRSMPY